MPPLYSAQRLLIQEHLIIYKLHRIHILWSGVRWQNGWLQHFISQNFCRTLGLTSNRARLILNSWIKMPFFEGWIIKGRLRVLVLVINKLGTRLLSHVHQVNLVSSKCWPFWQRRKLAKKKKSAKNFYTIKNHTIDKWNCTQNPLQKPKYLKKD